MTDEAYKYLSRENKDRDRRRLSAIIRARELQNLPALTIYSEWPTHGAGTTPTTIIDDLLSRWPSTPTERIERVLLNLKYLSPSLGQPVHYQKNDWPLFFALDHREFGYVLTFLQDEELVKFTSGPNLNGGDFTILPKGWEAIARAESKNRSVVSKNAFVAMSFSPELDNAYDHGIEPAINDAGDKPIRIDRIEHNEGILDEIIIEIRNSRFLVADMTEQKRGVYFEAGFARGLGLPVIFTCRRDDMKNVHFDIKQFNHIIWDLPEDLKGKLENRIKATII